MVANSKRARCFELHAKDGALRELVDFVQFQPSLESRAHGSDLTGAAGKGHGRTGHAGTQFEPRTEAHAKQRASFASELAEYLNAAVADQRCTALTLIASSAMLGKLKPCLNSPAAKALQACVARDLTRYQGADLQERVSHAIER